LRAIAETPAFNPSLTPIRSEQGRLSKMRNQDVKYSSRLRQGRTGRKMRKSPIFEAVLRLLAEALSDP